MEHPRRMFDRRGIVMFLCCLHRDEFVFPARGFLSQKKKESKYEFDFILLTDTEKMERHVSRTHQ